MTDMERVVEALTVMLLEDGVARWLMTPNEKLAGEVPLDLVAEGQAEKVLEEIERMSQSWKDPSYG